MRVLVTDGGSRAALAVTRSLGRAGHDVLVGERSAPCLAQASRHCTRALEYPDPAASSEAFIEAIDRLVTQHRVEVLLPVADIPTLLLTRHRARFEDRCAIPFAAAAAIDRAADKVAVLQTAESLGVPVPKSTVVGSAAEAEAGAFVFPLVIKPGRSRVQTPTGWVSSGVSYAADRDGLLRDLRARSPHDFPLLLQERIVGPGVGVFACYDGGRPIALFSHRRVREHPPWGGVSVLSESVAMDPVARDAAIALLDALHWHGVAMVEFKRDERGLPRLMEINGRFWGSLQLAIDAGVDFPALLVATVTEPGRVEAPEYRVGVQSRWLWGDVDSLLIDLFGRRGAAAEARRGQRLRSALGFMKFWGRDLYYENPRWGDLGPWYYETAQRVKQLGQRISGA